MVNARAARALWIIDKRSAELRDETVPGTLEPKDVLVRADCSLVSAGSEMNVYRGETSSAPEVVLPLMGGTLPFPVKYGYQVVGTVIEAGSACGHAAGERVFVRHPHQDLFVVDTSSPTVLYTLPPSVAPERAAFIGLCRVALNCLLDAPVRVGDCVAVSGLGVIGSLCAHLARRTAHTLVAIDPLPHRRELATWLRADATVAPEDASATIAELTNGRGVDVFIEASGAPPALQTALECTATEGTIVVPAWYGTRPVSLSLTPAFHFRRLRVISSFVGMIGSGLQPRWNWERQMGASLAELVDVPVESLITHRVPFAEAPRAYSLIDERPAETLGVLLDYHDDVDPARDQTIK